MKIEAKVQGLEVLFKEFEELNKVPEEAAFGIFEEQGGVFHEDTDTTVAQVAKWHEFGTDDGHVPARPFLRPTANEHKENFVARVAEEIAKLDNIKYLKRFLKRGLRRGAGMLAKLARARINAGISPSLAKETLSARNKRKSGVPLKDTNQMYRAIRGGLVKEGPNPEGGEE